MSRPDEGGGIEVTSGRALSRLEIEMIVCTTAAVLFNLAFFRSLDALLTCVSGACNAFFVSLGFSTWVRGRVGS